LRLIHQQPYDRTPYAGEVTIQSVIGTLDAGRLALEGLTLDQQVGTAASYDLTDGRTNTDPIKYKGQETAAPQRHIFEAGTSSVISARFYFLDDPDGAGIGFQLDHTKYGQIDLSGPGQMWDYQFTIPIYRPPAAAGADVLSTLETVSEQWISPASSEMRVIRSASLHVH
jgi:hypothetical protein